MSRFPYALVFRSSVLWHRIWTPKSWKNNIPPWFRSTFYPVINCIQIHSNKCFHKIHVLYQPCRELGGPGLEPRWKQIFSSPYYSVPAFLPTQAGQCRSFPGVKRPEPCHENPHYLAPRLQINRAIPVLHALCLNRYISGRPLPFAMWTEAEGAQFEYQFSCSLCNWENHVRH